MLFNSFSFLIFFPIILLVYFLLPLKHRWIWLLISSYYFYMNWNAAYAILLFLTTLFTWISGLLISKFNEIKIQKVVVAMSFIVNLGILIYYKYFVFLIDTINMVVSKFGVEFNIRSFDIILPVGISFYIFQALSYTVDILRGEIGAEKNFFRYALFVSFFPQLVAGPIERSKNLLKQLRMPSIFSYENLRRGILYMLWGYFMKLVVADNAAIVVDTIFGDINTYSGWYVIVGTILFSFQIYGDFGGYSLIAIGAAKILGFNLMMNFNAPYFADSVADFWRRWHISLSTWFRDYLYIPLGGNRKGKIRKYFNLLLVFLVSGLWHGASWHYVVWGGCNGCFQVIGEIASKYKKKFVRWLKINKMSFSYRMVKVIITYVLIDFCWLFFRVDNMTQAKEAIWSVITTHNIWVLFDGSLFALGLAEKQFRFLLAALTILLIVDYLKVKKINLMDRILRQPFMMRSIIYTILFLVVLVFGCWGGGYNENSFIYFQF